MIRITDINSNSNININIFSTKKKSIQFIKRGTPQFTRVTLALFLAGLTTCTLLYCVQPIFPAFSYEFSISPSSSSMSLSISTTMLAIGLLIIGPLSDSIGRKPIMVIALLLSSLCTIFSTMMNSWNSILLMRALVGLSLSGVVAVGITYLNEEIDPIFFPFSMGLYISGNSIGSIIGRLFSGIVTNFFGWRIALKVIGFFSLSFAIIFWKILPESRHFRATSLYPKKLFINFFLYWRDKVLPLRFLSGFLLMGAFVTLFNYIGYRLMQAPWFLSQSTSSLLSIVYLAGTWSSPKAGIMTIRFTRTLIIIFSTSIMLFGLFIMFFSLLWLIFLGMLLFSAGFFSAYSVSSSWINSEVQYSQGQISSLYLFSYYLGSSIIGTLGGIFWKKYGWFGVSSFIGMILFIVIITNVIIHKRLYC